MNGNSMNKHIILLSTALLMIAAMVTTNSIQGIHGEPKNFSNFNKNKIVNQNGTSVSSDNCGKDQQCKIAIDKLMDSLFGDDSNTGSQNKVGNENSMNSQNKQGNNNNLFDTSLLPF